MKRESTRRVAPEKAASPVEIAAAIESLTAAELLRLGQYAQRRIRLLGPKADGRVGDDLLQTALQDLLEDTRRWDKTKVGLMGFLFGAMKSISSNWAKSYEPSEVPVLETDLLRRDDESKVFSPLHVHPASQPTPEEHLAHRQILSAIDNLFRDDQDAQMLLTGWQEGLDPSGVRELWGLSQNDYNTIVRRIRRTIDTANLNPGRRSGEMYVQ
jgi:hypothetical protein